MKEYIEIFKNLWANKRIRSLIILVFYIVFFTIVILMFGNREISTNEIPKTALTEFRENKHYRYSLLVNNLNTYNINVFSSEAISLPEELKFLSNEFIYELMLLGELKGVNNNYDENYKDSIYKIEKKMVETLLENSSSITLTLREKEQKIEKVIIEFEESYNGLSTLELNYSW